MATTTAATENRPQEKKPGYFVRFSLRQRIEHIALMLLFVALAVTGLAQRYYTNGLSEWLILGLGGIETTRLLHRIMGVVFAAGMAYHFSYTIYMYLRHSRLAILPNFNDFRDVIAEVKHGFGLKAPRPQFHRYDYRQKFEYLGMMFGGVVLILSGFILMFPLPVSRLLTGEAIAVALQFHGYEATLAVLVIIIWHLYDVIFKPGIFPADTTIFTGRISHKRQAEEHYLEYIELMGREPGLEKTDQAT